MKPIVPKYCPTCRGVRPHTSEVRTLLVTSRKTRVRVCAGCEEETLQEGIFCPECGDPGSRTLYTRRPRPGAVTRVRACACGHRYRTVERMESMVVRR